MTSKRKSARPAESGWLLEVGVIGPDKTLKLLKWTGGTLLEIEQVLRPWALRGVNYTEKAKLPWLRISSAPWEARGSVDYGLYEDEIERLGMDLEAFEDSQKRKGKSRGRERERAHRPSFERWMITPEIMELFRPGPLDNDTERKKLERIRRHSQELALALEIISGRRRGASPGLSGKVKQIVEHSRAMPHKRARSLEAQITRARGLLKEHEQKGRMLRVQLELLREARKRVGRESV